jgi:hypothetical protein
MHAHKIKIYKFKFKNKLSLSHFYEKLSVSFFLVLERKPPLFTVTSSGIVGRIGYYIDMKPLFVLGYIIVEFVLFLTRTCWLIEVAIDRYRLIPRVTMFSWSSP